MSFTDSDLQIELEGLEYEIQVAKNRLPDYANRHSNTDRENALLYCLKRAIELSEGCKTCTKENLLTPQYLLTRGLLECLLWVCWIAKSQENAQAFVDAPRNELKRLAKKNLKEGHGRVVDKITSEDKTEELLNSDWSKDIRPLLKIEGIAKDVGLGKLYTQMYGFLSIFAHGIMLETNPNVKDEMGTMLSTASIFMECINLVVKDWIVDQKQTPLKAIYAILQ